MIVNTVKYAASKDKFLTLISDKEDPSKSVSSTCTALGLPLIVGWCYYGDKYGFDKALPNIQKLVDFYQVLGIEHPGFLKDSIKWAR